MRPLQDEVQLFLNETDLFCPAEFRLLDMQSELGEIGKELLKASKYGSSSAKITDALKAELGDLLFSLLAFACENDIQVDQQLFIAMTKYRHRLANGGTAGSNKIST